MAEGQDSADRTEAATPRRLERAREEGQVALSREAITWASLCGAGLAAAVTMPALLPGQLAALRLLLSGLAEARPAAAATIALQAGLLALLPMALGALVGAAVATLLQTGFMLNAKALVPDAKRLDPLAALHRLLGPEAVAQLLRTLLKLAVLGLATWWALDLPALGASVHQPAGLLLAEAGRQSLRLLIAVLAAFALVAGFDLGWVHWRHASSLRMSREELREEHRESEGDPHIKARLRQIRQTRARRRMLAQVPKAAVVITNPTHYAVALAYEQGQSAAPRLVAKGVDSMAARIRAAAEEHGVPIVANPPLARALYTLEPDSEIPPEHWQMVAEIIAYVWRLRGQVAAAARPAGAAPEAGHG
jgi:flagellar biosynthetic protein FlhB